MKKATQITLFILFAMYFASSTMAQTTNGWKQHQLKGKAKSFALLENYRYIKDGKFTEWGILYNKKYFFDNLGRNTEYVEFYANGDLNSKIKYTYNTKEKVATISYFDKEEKPTIKKLWVYDSKGQLSEIQDYTKENKPGYRYVYTYNTNGNRVMEESYRPDNTPYSKATYTFDAKGNETGYLLQTQGYANSSRKYAYDDKSNKIEEIWLNGKEEITFRFVRAYDSNGNMIEELTYKGNEKAHSSKSTWKYEYDSKGNWIKRTQYTNDGVEFDIAERKITYY